MAWIVIVTAAGFVSTTGTRIEERKVLNYSYAVLGNSVCCHWQ